VATCAQVESLSQAYLDGELGVSEKAIFEQHLSACRACSATLERQRAISALLFESFNGNRLERDLLPGIMAHLPEMDDQRLVREVNKRAKQPVRRSFPLLHLLTPAFSVAVLLLAAAVVYFWPSESSILGQPVGMITYLRGDVYAEIEGADARHRASVRNVVGREHEFTTGADAALAVGLAGPTLLKVDAETNVVVGDDRRLRVDQGRIWLHVSKGARVFRVNTPQGDISVFGTTFGVTVAPDKTVVTLLEGEVTVENDITFAVLRDGEQVEVSRGVSPLTPRAVDAVELLAWADAIQPDNSAHALFLASVRPLAEAVLEAESMWRVETGGHTVSSLAFEWRAGGPVLNRCGYFVYVTDERNNPLFVRQITARELAYLEKSKIEIPVPSEALRPGITVFIRLVPDTASGSVETVFTSVSLVGV